MARRTVDVETDTLSLSFLDLISCGLGGAIFLSLIFSVVRQDKPSALTSQHFLDVTVECADSDAVLNLVVTPPRGAAHFLPVTTFDSVTGLLPVQHELRKSGEIMLLGFSGYGEVKLAVKQGQLYKLLVHDPKPGHWMVEVQYRDRRNWTNLANGIPKVTVTRKVITSRGEMDSIPAQEVSFGDGISQFDGKQPIVVENPRYGSRVPGKT
jgi:hypothetical protein